VSERLWRFTNLEHPGFERTCSLRYFWEVAGDPITDDYLPEETSAGALLMTWSAQAWRRYPDGQVPIFWYVQGPDQGVFEAADYCRNLKRTMAENPGYKTGFLHYFTWPVDPDTGERINWMTLPVADKFWNLDQADKGGFIQEATGWKPSALAPTVDLDALMAVTA